MSRASEKVRAKTSQVAAELWPLVQNEKRSDGTPVFVDRNGLISHLSYAFHRKRIGGAQSGRSSSIWLDKNATLNYVAKYVELAKESAKVIWPAAGKRKAVMPTPEEAPASSNGAPSTDLEFVAVTDEGGCRPVSGASVEEAAYRIVTELGMRFYQVDGNRLTLAGKLDPWDK